ncbi:U4/U6.U5 small nuclear ribonucleoprotein 27 kDa protein-like isoform X1 [Rhopilema esculentum]|uniref:U4/U6.U5 small nuclear ribonucleoprotein 27 kDa protein-like isoform X1 n=1 Tax=Rhopilema esculentum TaxID=499914 RepID=UPI0031D2B5D5
MPGGNVNQRSRSRSPVRRERRRSRSRSPRRHRSRSPRRKDRERHNERDGARERSCQEQQLSQNPTTHLCCQNLSPRSRSKAESTSKSKTHEQEEEVDDDTQMMQMMGFSSFDTTKGKHVKGQMEGCVKIEKAKKYRQYMNRRGGFNRPLDYVT